MEILIVGRSRHMSRHIARLNEFSEKHPGSRVRTCWYQAQVAGMRFDLVLLVEPPEVEKDTIWLNEILAYRLREHGIMVETYW